MKEITGNLWDYQVDGNIVITTNGAVNSRGECVMGRGTAAQAKVRYPHLPKLLGTKIITSGNHVYSLTYGLYSFPVKHHWSDFADPELISRSAIELLNLVNDSQLIFLPRPGCGNGGLKWENVKPLLRCLDDRFTIVERHP